MAEPGSPRAILLMSGGLDSTTCLSIALKQGFEVLGLSFRYGQRHEAELKAAQSIAAHYGIQKIDLELDLFKRLGSSSLTGAAPVPKDRGAQEMGVGIPSTYVPARNLLFLSYAVAVAEIQGAKDLFIGVNAVDYSGYPDCRPEFIQAFEHTATLATRQGVEGQAFQIHSPLLHWSKAEIIRQGSALDAPYHLSHSCYDPNEAGISCARCDACQLRLQGFKAAGLEDPIPYQRS